MVLPLLEVAARASERVAVEAIMADDMKPGRSHA